MPAKSKRPEFKPPFPAAPVPPKKAKEDEEVLTNEADQDQEEVVVETVPSKPEPTKAASLSPDESNSDSTEEGPAPQPVRRSFSVGGSPDEGGPKFVSKSAATLTRAPVTDILKEDDSKSSASKNQSPDSEASGPEPVSSSPSPQKPTPSPRSPDSSPSSSFFVTGIVVFSLIFGLSGWILYLNTKFNFIAIPSMPKPDQNVTQEVTPTPEVSPTPINNRADITLEILNGSGTAGVAGTTAEKLEGLGYTILEIGNADNQNYARSEIYTAADFATSELLLSDIAADLPDATVSGDLKDSTASARIIIGKDWGE